MTKEEFAVMLNGREYRDELPQFDHKKAMAAGLLVVFGASDDLTEFGGIIRDERGAYYGMDHKIIRNGSRWELTPEIYDCPRCQERDDKAPGVVIRAEWCPEGFDGSWRISANIPHATFDIVEDGELYCRGIVIAEHDMIAAISAKDVEPTAYAK